ncbi:carboxy terminal-processing peptidase [Pontibacter akesuensis]|uniref:Carboxyl-terminal processing protease n=1 Tax=Pontibacter akesuensis TaxID=388950 RepID=A0A1I7K136_9BACT|nr:carboxy terminal-processing peptidase [Pontibacter akesuensis]GHA75955.1 tail-specific protease [Pontibacter akesuensis]SFU91080.1 carboxyl-terminal processing protease [Pontibacter akesuensis]
MLSLTTRFKIILSVLAVILVTGSFILTKSDDVPEGKNEILIRALMQGLSQGHYQPEKVDDSFSKKVFKLYLDRLDYNKKFLLASDVAKLRQYETAIDDELRQGAFKFFDMSADLIEQRTKESKAYYKEILAKPFDFSKDEKIELDGEKLTYATSPAELKEAWRKQLKYQTLVRLVDMQEEQKQKLEKDAKAEQKSFEEMEKEARKKVMENYDLLYDRLSQVTRDERRSTYINAVTNVYDPHTSYFAPKDKENFDIGFTGRLEGIGASLTEKDGQIRVNEIVPGSPSYLQGDLKPGDVIQKVGQADEEPVLVEGMRLDDAIQLIRGKKGTMVRLTVKKPDGSTKVVPIVRDVIVIEDTYAQSAVIQDKEKIGYIKLPGFYADFEDRNGRFSGADVKKEVEKLKAAGMQGLILDLRNNGGGSLSDAVEMAGLFIEKGPIVQVKTAEGKAIVLDDRDAQVQYGGPLVILVNSNSASASEILAAAMQDYKRAVIVGSPTYGKGTVQQFVELDQALPAQFNPYKPFGALKLTTQKFYRINGGTTQLRGVIPDVTLPDPYSYMEFGEKEQDFPLPFDEISPAKYKPWDKSNINLAQIKANSQKRIASNQSFGLIEQAGQRLKKQMDNTSRSLQLEKYTAEERKAKAEAKRLEDAQKEVPVLDVQRLKADLQELGADSAKVARNKEFIKSLKQDVYVEEAVSILQNGLK